MLLIRRTAAVVLIAIVALVGAACDNNDDDTNPAGTGERQESPTSLPDTQETNPPLQPEGGEGG